MTLRSLEFQGGERPMTGMTFTGTRRQVMDKSFFITELRARRSDLHKEIGNLADEIASLERDKAISSQISKRFFQRPVWCSFPCFLVIARLSSLVPLR